MFTVREAVLDFCLRLGMTTVFGNPGSTELRIFRDFPAEIRYVLALQESVAVAAAAGYALGTGTVGLVHLHSAGGVGHGLGAVFNAYRDRVPLLVFAGQQTRAMLHRSPPGRSTPTSPPVPGHWVRSRGPWRTPGARCWSSGPGWTTTAPDRPW